MEQYSPLTKPVSYPLKALYIVGLSLGFTIISSIVGILFVMMIYGSNGVALISSQDFNNIQVVNSLKIVQFFSAVIGMLGVVWAYTKIFKTPVISDIVKKPKPYSVLFYVLLVFLVATPFIAFSNEINQLMRLPQFMSGIENWMKAKETQAEHLMEAFIKVNNPWDIVIAVFLMAVIPAICEEFLFRGVIASLLQEWTKNIHWAAWISGFIFSAIHLQFYGFLPRFIMGVMLAYLFLWSGNIWFSVAAHFLNNFMAVMGQVITQKNTSAKKDITDISIFNYPVAIVVSLVLTVVLMVFIYKRLSAAKISSNY